MPLISAYAAKNLVNILDADKALQVLRHPGVCIWCGIRSTLQKLGNLLVTEMHPVQ